MRNSHAYMCIQHASAVCIKSYADMWFDEIAHMACFYAWYSLFTMHACLHVCVCMCMFVCLLNICMFLQQASLSVGPDFRCHDTSGGSVLLHYYDWNIFGKTLVHWFLTGHKWVRLSGRCYICVCVVLGNFGFICVALCADWHIRKIIKSCRSDFLQHDLIVPCKRLQKSFRHKQADKEHCQHHFWILND